ncbi:sigma 54-interacting transcriptional regulator [Stenotrophomonas maltophilia]|uniref:sigma-54 interaction domain-containing protein n=1 Tax=Stenotrophomonas maltophilia TaxID=40324 RepID=UPI0018D3ECB4|nr:sigma-54-dependent Fis family transcriptional regulator [Stenotrophomonas maltophilia]
MTALQALQVVQATLRGKDANDTACAWMAAIGRMPVAPAAALACYRVDDAAQSLYPVAGLKVPVRELPVISMADLEHPAVYCLVQRGPCLVSASSVSQPSVQALIAAMKSGPGLLAIPVVDVAVPRAIAVVLLAGPAEMLRRFQRSPEWVGLVGVLQHALAQGNAQLRVDRVPAASSEPMKEGADLIRSNLVGQSVPARRLRAEVLAAADSRLAVLITGETGTGKDHAASLIHRASTRRDGAFVPLNCAAIAPELIAAELFGAVKGAYTGATSDRPGLVAAADGGTLFLDEIGDMPLALQGTLLRVLNEKTYRPLGAVRERASDFRLVCATHRPLLESVREGRFRQDLYFRIRQLTLVVPPLRERRTDIPLLVNRILARLASGSGSAAIPISECAIRRLQQHDYPGNIRELATLIEVAAERATCNGIDAEMVELLLQKPLTCAPAMPPEPMIGAVPPDHSLSLSEARDQFERRIISSRLRHFNGSRARTARSLDIARRTLLYKCKRLGLGDAP